MSSGPWRAADLSSPGARSLEIPADTAAAKRRRPWRWRRRRRLGLVPRHAADAALDRRACRSLSRRLVLGCRAVPCRAAATLCRGAAAGRSTLQRMAPMQHVALCVATYGSNGTCCSLRCNMRLGCNVLLCVRCNVRLGCNVLLCVRCNMLLALAVVGQRRLRECAGASRRVRAKGRSCAGTCPRALSGHVGARVFVCSSACSLRARSAAARAQTASQRRIGPTLQVCVQRTARNMQPTACNIINMQPTACDRHHATDNMHMHHTDWTASLKPDLA